ncbi:MAG: DUF262 domain-containing protein, partial [Deltaproteobacteria bacterium]|nr:DUF262 domain-containing protein [Deltaproteobacteria bacterium]
RIQQLRGSYIGFIDPVTLIAQSKLTLNRHNNAYYQNYLVPLEKLPQRGIKASEHQLRKAFGWFREKLKRRVGAAEESGKEIASFLDQLVDKLVFTVISVTDELNAFKVFETLNARGVRLSSTDLLKNYLFSVIASSDSVHDTEMNSLEERWERIVDWLGSERFPEFLRIFWNSKNKLVRKSELFKTIRHSISTKEQAFKLLRELDTSASIYAALRDPQDSIWNDVEKDALKQLLMFSVKQPLAMLLACNEKFYESNRNAFTRILKAVVVVSFRYNVICNLQPQEQERLYNDIARRVSEGEYGNVESVLRSLKDIYPDDDRFKAAFSEKGFRTTNSRNKKIVRYIMFKIESQRSEQQFDFESASITLEHILPENPGAEWSHIDESKQDSLIFRLGNMTLLKRTANRDLGNSGYEQKKTFYKESGFQMTRAIAENYEEWDEDKVDSRQKQLANVAVGIWKVEFGD